MRAGVPSGLHSRQPRAGGRARCFDGEVSVVAGFFGFLTLRHLPFAWCSRCCVLLHCLPRLTKTHLAYLWFFAVRCTLGAEVRTIRCAFLAFLCFVLTGQIVWRFLCNGFGCSVLRFDGIFVNLLDG